jgi:hypothetical protein
MNYPMHYISRYRLANDKKLIFFRYRKTKSDENSLVQYSNIFRQAYTRSQTIEDFEKPN